MFIKKYINDYNQFSSNEKFFFLNFYMFKYRKKIDEKIAAKVVKYIAQTTITPNQVSTFSLLLAAFAAVFFSFGIYFFSVIDLSNSVLFLSHPYLQILQF